MKTKLLLLSLAFTGLTYGQTVDEFYNEGNKVFIRLTGNPDQINIGPNATWNFNLTQNGKNTAVEATSVFPITGEYPGTTNQEITYDENFLPNTENYYKKDGDNLYITGTVFPNFTVKYKNDNLYIGEFPLNYGSSTDDDIAGELVGEGASSTPLFTGSSTTEVDAYGTLNINALTASNVTRITVTQEISFTYETRLGKADITNRYYYGADGTILFKTTDGEISIEGNATNEPTNEEIITRELSEAFSLSNDSFKLAQSLALLPNPVTDVLNINTNAGVTIQSLQVINAEGRIILTPTSNLSSLDVSALQNGLYILKANTNKGVITKKFVKN